MAIVVQRRVSDYCNGSRKSKNYTDLEYILDVIFAPGTWRYRTAIIETGKTRKRKDGKAGSLMRVVVMRHGIENFDLAKLHLGCLLGHSHGC